MEKQVMTRRRSRWVRTKHNKTTVLQQPHILNLTPDACWVSVSHLSVSNNDVCWVGLWLHEHVCVVPCPSPRHPPAFGIEV